MVRRLVSFLLMIMVLVVALISNEVIHAKDTFVQYSPEQDIYYQTKVIVIGNGSVMDGTQTIREGVTVFELLYGTTKEFKILPDQGYELKSVILDGINRRPENSRILIQQKRQQMLIVITFQKADQLQPPQPEQQDPLWPDVSIEDPNTDPMEEKEIISIIIKDIMVDDMEHKDILDIIKDHIISEKPYKIISHNVQRKPGTYEVVIQFEDGTIQILHINVIGEVKKDGTTNTIHPPSCYIHWFMILVTMIYILLGLRGTYLRHQLIQAYREKEYKKDDTGLHRMKKKSVLAILTTLCITFLYVIGQCPWDLISYLVCSIFIMISILHTYRQLHLIHTLKQDPSHIQYD